MHRRVFLIFGVAVFAAACTRAAAEPKILYEKKSPYTTIVVTEDEGHMRTLLFEKGGARQSVVKVGDPDHLELPYARSMLAALALCPKPERVLVVGLGGGSLPSILHKHFPQTAIDVVDIDPEVVYVAKRFFDFREDATMRAVVADGRRFIQECRNPYDIILLDAFSSDDIPYHLATQEFLQAVRKALKPNGVVAANIWSLASNPLHDHMVRTYQEIFEELCILDVPNAGNEILIALPVAQRMGRDDLARRAAEVSKQQHFRFDLGELVRDGFRHASEKDPAARILTDRERPRPE